ncbi:MAG: NFACT family protein [Candidatus Diapherotrites archaeon]|nr:NFACT family protein [Candidatus Diapherotrites archaeon]
MQLTNLTFARLVFELKPKLEGSFINKVQQIDENCFKFKIHSKEGNFDLIIRKDSLWITSYKHQAFQSRSKFIQCLESLLNNKKIISVEQHNFDRIIVFYFDNYKLIFEFFHDSNIIFVDKDNKIICCLKKEEWSDRKVAKNEKYVFPKQKGLNPFDINYEKFSSLFLSEEKSFYVLQKNINIPPLLVEEIFIRANIDKDKLANSLTDKEIEKIYNLLKSMVSLDNFEGAYLKKGTLLTFKVEDAQLLNKNSIVNALDEYFSKTVQKDLSPDRSFDIVKRLEASIQRQKIIKKELIEKSEEFKKKAELIYENYQDFNEIISAIKKALAKGYTKKQITNILSNASSKGNRVAKLVKDIDMKERKVILEV